MKRLLPLLLAAFFTPLIGLYAQVQITDFLYKDSDKASRPSDYVRFNNLIFFEASTGGEGRELWVSDGSSSGTRILKDINPGNSDGIITSFRQSSVILDGQLFFVADDGENGSQLWSTKGTEQTTKRVTNLTGFNASSLTLVGNRIFFLIKRGHMQEAWKSNGMLEVWKSDGTAQGTAVVMSQLPIWNEPSFEGTANGLFFFTFQPRGTNNSRLWRSDGSASGTFPVTGEMDGNGANRGTSRFTQYIVFNNELYFVARSGTAFSYPITVGILKTDGTLANTVPVKAVHEGHRLVSFADVIEIRGKLYFSFFEADYSRLFIWESDGTSTGTKKIYDESGSKYYATSNLTTDGKDLVLIGKSKNSGTALLRLKVDNYAIEEIKELVSEVKRPLFYSPEAAFQISKFSHDRYLIVDLYINTVGGWVTDLTEANTNPIDHLKSVTEVIVVDDGVFFAGSDSQQGTELWKADFAFTSTQLVRNINTSKFGFDDFYYRSAVLGNKTFFQANNGNDHELWVYDSITEEKTMVKGAQAGSLLIYPKLVVFDKHVYFIANDDTQALYLWKSDGTEAGTVAVSTIPWALDNNFLTVTGGKLFFVSRLEDQFVLYATDGNTTEEIKKLGVTRYGDALRVREMVAAGDYIFFSTYGDREELWKSDGTESGTLRVKEMFSIMNLTAVNDKVYFTAAESSQGESELWYSDGTGAGTKAVVDIGAGYSSNPSNFVAYEGSLVFSAFTLEHGREYWITNGTPEETRQLADIYPGASSSVTSPTHYAIFNSTLYLTANDGTHGTELWKTNGSGAGTMLVSDIQEGSDGSFPKHLIADSQRLYFSAYTAENGAEVWTTEGTLPTTKLFFDIEEGLKSSNPSNFLICGDELLFVAETIPYGRQLWSSKKGAVTGIEEPYEAEPFTLYPNPASDYIYIDSGKKSFKLLRIVNLNGQSVPVKDFKSGKIYIGDLLPGLYLLVAEVDKKAVARKFIRK